MDNINKKDVCPKCNSNNINRISRICGYFSKVSNWSKSKQEEKRKRQLGDYSIQQDPSNT